MRIRAFSVVAMLMLAACGNHQSRGAAVAHGESRPIAVPEASEDAFASTVHQLLVSEPGSAARETSLAAAVARQMSRATNRFKTRAPEQGLLAVTGGLALVKTGELRPGLLGQNGREAVRLAARELSARGDEGRARALFEILARMWPDTEGADARSHIAALASWSHDATKTLGPVASAGAQENAAVSRRLLEPSQVARDEATSATTAWVARALVLNENFRKHRVPPPQEEGREAYRALKTAPLVFAAIYLRDGDAKGAIDAIDAAQARELVRPELMHALEGAADKADATHWLAVVNALHPARDDEHEASSDDSDDEEIMGDRDVLRVATLGAALEAYRLDPSVPEAAGTIAASLEVMGMAEASPAVLFDAVKAHPEAKIVSGALAITMHAMAGELAADDVEAARRVYRAALPLIAIADDAKLAGKLSPSSSRVQAMMGEIELREGRLPEAHALLEAALKKEKSGAVLLALARIDRYEQRVAAALEDLREALAQKDTVSEPALRGEVLLLTSDITREQGDGAAARTPLIEALHELEKARTGAEGDNRARIERTLARVLDRFGADKRAEKVLEHALDAAPRNKSEAAATIGDLVARSFVHGDLKAARDGLQRGLAADLDNDDLVYYALWVRLLERQLRVTTDGVADRIFASALEGPRWPGRLAAFGAGLIKSNELIAAARTPSQKTEALFYAAMDKRAAGDVKGSNDQLRQVMSAGGVDQMEVAIARDLLSGVPRVPGPLPAEIAQP